MIIFGLDPHPLGVPYAESDYAHTLNCRPGLSRPDPWAHRLRLILERSSKNLALVAYSTPQGAYEKLIPAFQATSEGKGVSFSQSFGPSGEQSRAVANGLHADVVNFSLEPDVEKLVKAGLVSPTWNQNATHGFVTNSVAVIIVRKGNPKHITGWSDLIKPGVRRAHAQPLHLGQRALEHHGRLRRAAEGRQDPSTGARNT